ACTTFCPPTCVPVSAAFVSPSLSSSHRYSDLRHLLSFPTRRSSDLHLILRLPTRHRFDDPQVCRISTPGVDVVHLSGMDVPTARSEEHTSELQSRFDLVCRLLLEKKKTSPSALPGALSCTKHAPPQL